MPDLRKDPITGRWVIIATDRARRPTDFLRETARPKGGRICPLCPGFESKTPPEILAYRTSGGMNEPGWNLRVVPNKFPALRIEGELNKQADGFYDRMNGVGAHELLVECPDHMSTLSDLSEKQMADVFFAFRDRINDLRKDTRLRYMVMFRNHGESAGATLEHAHSQLIALPVVPKRVQEEIDGAKRHYEYRERCIFCDIVQHELASGSRVVLENDSFVALAPYASRFPFETWILPKKHHSHFERADTTLLQSLGWVLRNVARKLDKVLETPPHNLIIHTSPVQDADLPHYHWHIEFIPKLTRVAGFEWGSGFYINPTPPEEAARYLREAGLP